MVKYRVSIKGFVCPTKEKTLLIIMKHIAVLSLSSLLIHENFGGF